MPEGVSSCRFVKKYPERKRDRILSDDEYRRLTTALGTPSAGGFALAVAIAGGFEHATGYAALIDDRVPGRTQNVQGKQRYEQMPGDIMHLFHELVESPA